MLRPASIINFERLYLGSFVLWAINTFASWSTMRAMIANNPQVAANPMAGSVMGSMLGTSAIITAAVSLLLWWLVARKASVVGKWMVVVTEGIGALLALFSLVALATGKAPSMLLGLSSLVATGLAIAAAVMLFRPDARAFLGEGGPNVGDTFR